MVFYDARCLILDSQKPEKKSVIPFGPIKTHKNNKSQSAYARGASVVLVDLRGCGFKPHRRHCVVSLSKTH